MNRKDGREKEQYEFLEKKRKKKMQSEIRKKMQSEFHAGHKTTKPCFGFKP